MLSRNTVFVAAVLAASSTFAQSGDPIFQSGFEAAGAINANWQANLDVHNGIRAGVSPTANPALPAMQWDETVATVAQAHANRCVFSHSSNGYGENIYASTGFHDGEEDAALMWAQEVAHYDYATNSCASGRQCGHYTQMVWRTSTRLGCGIRHCSTGSPWGGGDWTVVVCNYSAPGNYGGQRPY